MVRICYAVDIKMQTKKHSHFEVVTNQAVGLILGWLIVYFIFPFMGMESTATTATASSVIFFISSYLRSYVIRRVFNRLTYGKIN